MVLFSLPELAPDRQALNQPFTDIIINLFPKVDGYYSVPALQAITPPLEGENVNAAIYFLSPEFGSVGIIGTKENLYFLNTTTQEWLKVNNPNRKYTLLDGEKWSFAIFGQSLIAVHRSTVPQVLDLTRIETFRDLGGNPPIANAVAVWENFLVLFNLVDHPTRIMWSGLNDIEWWIAGKKNCDYQDFPDGGMIQGTTSSVNPLIFTRNAIYKATFIPGSEFIFNFQKIHISQGVIHAEVIAGRGNIYFFIADNGFFQINEMGDIQSIDLHRMNHFLFKRRERSFSLFVDPIWSRLYCLEKSEQTDMGNRIFVYDWVLQSWSCLEIQAKLLVPIWLPARCLEDLDKEYQSLEEIADSLDFMKNHEDAPYIGVIGKNNQISVFTGETMEATIITQKIGLTDGQKHRLVSINPLIDTCEISVCLLRSETIQEEGSWSVIYKASPRTGLVQCRSRARYHRIKFMIAAGVKWTNFVGYETDIFPAGRS